MPLIVARRDSDWLSNFFSSSVRDSKTPAVRHTAHVLYVPYSHDPEVTRHCSTVLSGAELQRADNFVTQGEAALFTQRRAFRRFCGAQVLGSSKPLYHINFRESDNGRPYLAELPDVWFSFSSCRLGFIGAWSLTHGVGVDIEDPTRNLDVGGLAREFFSSTEVGAIQGRGGLTDRRVFFDLWCLKEAALKSLGKGLLFGLDAFEFELEPVLQVVQAPEAHGGPERFHAQLINDFDGCAALVTRNPS